MRAVGIFSDRISRLLDPGEREAVLGDLEEMGVGPWQALTEIGGLVLRREAGHLSNWRPWVAALGVSVPTSFMFMGESVALCAGGVSLAAAVATRQPYAPAIEMLAVQALLLAGWAWTCGRLVGSLSRRTAWFSILAYGSPCLFCLSRFRVASLSRLSLLLFVLPLAMGLWQGLRKGSVGPRIGVATAAVVTALAIIVQLGAPGGAGIASRLISNLVQTWPAWCLAAISLKGARERAGTGRSPFERNHHEHS